VRQRKKTKMTVTKVIKKTKKWSKRLGIGNIDIEENSCMTL